MENVITNIEFKGNKYEVPSYLQLVEQAPGFLISQAGAGDEQAGVKLLIFAIEKLPDSEFKTLITSLPSKEYAELVEAWAFGEVGK